MDFIKKRNIVVLLFAVFITADFFSQEALKSTEEEYYDFLSLNGIVECPTLGYRTLSDSVWNFTTDENGVSSAESENNVWKNNNLGTIYTLFQPSNISNNYYLSGVKQGLFLKIYGPEWYNSFNTAAPYGQNDGALWQGKGYNTSFTTGARIEGYGLELTLKPQVCFQQNLSYEIMPSAYDSEYGYFWGYAQNVGVDCPQRFGASPFWTFDWGDSEIRYTWKTLTVGFGTQSIWLGPAWLNPLLLSNNAATFPKFDFGLRKTAITIPWTQYIVGYLESRIVVGYLSESDFFDNDDSNNHNLLNVFSLFFSPSFLPGFTVGVNKVCLSKWGENFWKYANPFYSGNTAEDQKISFTAEYLVPQGGIDVFSEVGVDDTINYPSNTLESYITHIFHTMTFTVGLKKTVNFGQNSNLYGEILFECNNTEMSQDMQFQWPYSFGFHNIITQGYTNRGQWLGSGIGYGGNSQYLGFNLYYPKGNTLFFIHRYNPDNNYLYKNAIYAASTGEDGALHTNNWNSFKGVLAVGFVTTFFTLPSLSLDFGFIYDLIINPLYNTDPYYVHLQNFQIQNSIKYTF